MTIMHHPKDETLADHSAGTLDAARQFVVEAHLWSCARCRTTVTSLESIGGELLEAASPVAMGDGALESVLTRLGVDRQAEAEWVGTGKLRAELMRDVLERPDTGHWHWVGPGLRMRNLYRPTGSGARLFLLKAAPGLGLPDHTHTGSELTLVLQGAFTHEGGQFGPGDCDDADAADLHKPVVDAGTPCICLVAMDGQLKLQGLLGRMAQPFVRL